MVVALTAWFQSTSLAYIDPSQASSAKTNILDSVPYVILTDLPASDPYFAAVRQLQEYREATIVVFDPNHVASVQNELRSMLQCLLR